MKALVVGLMLVSLASGQLAHGEEPIVDQNSYFVPAAAASNQFGFDLYQQLLESSEGNLLVSPTSISLALAMTSAGAEGQTREEIAAVLHFDLETPEEKLHADQADLLAALTYGSDPQEGGLVAIANRIWVQQGYELLPEFVRVTGERYAAELAEAPFATDTDSARQEINGWVEEQTYDKIQNLFPEGSLDASTALVLVNTVYFRDDWAYPFSPELTEDAPFHLSAEETVEAPLMFKEEVFAYADLGDYQLIALPYNNMPEEIDFNSDEEPVYDPAYSMLVLLPKEVDGLPAIEAELSNDKLAEWLGALEQEPVKLYLPRFTSNAEFDLAETLAALGMPSAFTPGQADFSGISSESELWISAVKHKTFIAVDEEGTEAAAATGIAMMRGGPPRGRIEFRADRPFLYMIMNQETGAVLFLGRVTNPTE